MYGELVPVGGGDNIPLLRASLTIGRRESCDIVLRFSNVSGQHCQLTMENDFLKKTLRHFRDLHPPAVVNGGAACLKKSSKPRRKAKP